MRVKIMEYWMTFLKSSFLVKLVLAIVGGLLALVFSGDIDEDVRLKLSLATLIKVVSAVVMSLTGTPLILRYMEWTHWMEEEKGFVYFMSAVFGVLVVGIIWRAIEIYKGKPPSEIVSEIKRTIQAIVGQPTPYQPTKPNKVDEE